MLAAEGVVPQEGLVLPRVLEAAAEVLAMAQGRLPMKAELEVMAVIQLCKVLPRATH